MARITTDALVKELHKAVSDKTSEVPTSKPYLTQANINELVADERQWQILQGHTLKKDRQRGLDFLRALAYFHLHKGEVIKALAVTQAIIDLRNPNYKQRS